MRTKHKSPKTLGRQAAELVTELYERGKPLFSHADVREITGQRPGSARNLASALVRRGIATRLKPGLFMLVPSEMGRAREYLGNPYVVASALAGGAGYYLSHASAMDIHRMVTQPQLVVYTTVTHAIRPRRIMDTEFRFVLCKPDHLFGTSAHWITKTRQVQVSDLERTVIDGLKHTGYCGGITEVARGFWMRRGDMDLERLVDYALRLGVGAVIRRLGFLLETFDAGAPDQIRRLQGRLTASYALLDPLLPPEGKFLARWRLRLNVAPDEFMAAVRT